MPKKRRPASMAGHRPRKNKRKPRPKLERKEAPRLRSDWYPHDCGGGYYSDS